MTEFWSQWIIWLTIITFAGVCWILFANRKITPRKGEDQGTATTGHSYDGIEELDNPLPAWWFNLFVITIVFGVVYLLLMPGLGNFKGLLGWTSQQQWENEVSQAESRFAAQYSHFMEASPEELSTNTEAMQMAGRVFANNCAVCHGSGGTGNFGFPNLTDNDWLFGGSSQAIRQSIAQGRRAAMPAWGSILNDGQLQAVAGYVSDLSAGTQGSGEGQQVYATYCAACHGVGGDGNPLMGAPRLNDSVWLYGGDAGQIIHSIRAGRNGVMPAHAEQLSEAKIHLLTAYVLSLAAE